MPSLQLSGEPSQHDPLDDIFADEGLPLRPLKVATPAGEICVNGELISRTDVDALEAGLRWIDRAKAPHRQALKMLDIAESQIREAVRDLAKGPQKTQRLAGANGAVLKVELPSDGWDQSRLIAAWINHPEYRDNCLKINEIGVKLVDWKKLLSITDPPAGLAEFIAAVKSAVRKATALPKVVVESKEAIDVTAMTPVEGAAAGNSQAEIDRPAAGGT